MMGINFRILLPFLLFYDIQVSSAQTVRNVVTYTTKPVEEFKCQFKTSIAVQWKEVQDGGGTIGLFTYYSTTRTADKEATDEKYNNFDYYIDQANNSFNLLITNVDKDDEGRYLCNPLSEPAVTYDVSVDVLPTSVNISCTELNFCASSAGRKTIPQIVCSCNATGVRSRILEIEWEAINTLTVSNTTRNESPTSGSFNISSEITLPPPDGNSSISCSLTGYESQIPERLRSDTYTFSPPVCNMVHACLSDSTAAVLTCDCTDGSPNISAYRFYNSRMLPIGQQFCNSNTLKVDADEKNTFYCRGYNGVKHNQTAKLVFICQQGLPWWFFLIIIGIPLALLVLVIWVVKKCKQGEVDPNRHKSNDGSRSEKDPLHGKGVEDPEVMKHVPSKDVPAPKHKDEAKTHLLYENTTIQDQQKIQDPGVMNPDPLKGDPALKKNDKGETRPVNETQTQSTGSEGAPNKKKPKKETPKGVKDKQENVEPGLPKGEDDNKDSKEKEEEEKPESAERLGPEGKETTVNGQENVKPGVSGGENDNTDSEEKEQSQIDVGSQVDSGARQSEKDVGSQVDSGERQSDTIDTPATGNQLRSPPALSAAKKLEIRCVTGI